MAIKTRPQVQTARIHIALTPAEKEKLDIATIQAKMPRSEFIRNVIAHYLECT